MPSIIGAGVSGCTLARVLAEADYIVHVYEAADRLGGMAYQYNSPFTLTDNKVKNFLYGRVSYQQVGQNLYAPLTSWHAACEELLFHKNISHLTWAPVRDIHELVRKYDVIYSSVSPDKLLTGTYGILGYTNDIPTRTPNDLVLYEHYIKQLERLGIVSFGYHGSYKKLTIEECIGRALFMGETMIARAPHKSLKIGGRTFDAPTRFTGITREETSILKAPKEAQWAIHQGKKGI